MSRRVILLIASTALFGCPPGDDALRDGPVADGDGEIGPCEGRPFRYVAGTPGPDTAWGVATTASGDVLLASHEGPALATDIVVRRLSPDGAVRWVGRWDSGRGDEAFVVTQAADGTVWVGGLTRSSNVLDANTTAVLLRFDSATGATIGQPWTWDSGGWDELDGIAVDDGVVYVSGWGRGARGDQELRVYALDADTLAVRWAKSLDAVGLDAGNGHLVLWDQVVVVGGSWQSKGVFATAQGTVAAFRRSDGEVTWSSVVGDGSDYREILGLASDGHRIFAVGWRKVTTTDWQLMAWGFDAEGGPLWTAEWGGSGNERSRAAVFDPADQTLIVAGTTNKEGSDDDFVLLRIRASSGAIVEERIWGGPAADSANDVTIFGNRAYVSGPTRSWGAGNIDSLMIGLCHRPWLLPDGH